MYVEQESAALFQRIVDKFGQPTPSKPDTKELFGYYHFENDTRYLSFDPRTQAWAVVTANDRYEERAACDNVPAEEQNRFQECFCLLNWLPRPTPPADKGVRYRAEPFLCSGWLFAWFWIPELARWELGQVSER